LSAALDLVKRSPEVVGRHDKAAWLDLFTDDARVEDPVGAGAHVGKQSLSAFWDVFIAPHAVTFHPKGDFQQGDVVVRHVDISTITAVDSAPLVVPAIIEYRVREGRIASLRAFWEPARAVGWYAKHGARGIGGLLSHGGRMTLGLGLGGSMGFGKALFPSVSRARGRAIVERFAADGRTPGGERAGAKIDFAVDEVLVAGDHVAAVLSSSAGAAALLARVSGDRIEEAHLFWGLSSS
jgi:ketosteroid isomerase-like protein